MDYRIFTYFLLVLAFTTGCAEQAYDGESISSEKVAVLKNSYTSRGGVKSDRADIIAVDGDFFDGSTPGRVELLPGKHSVVIRCWHGGLISEKSTGLQGHQGSVEFMAEAGREYKAFCSVSDGNYVKWITDLTTDEIVGREQPITSR
jgi:hypothetical protein